MVDARDDDISVVRDAFGGKMAAVHGAETCPVVAVRITEEPRPVREPGGTGGRGRSSGRAPSVKATRGTSASEVDVRAASRLASPSMGWQARLRGHAFDLETLTRLFREGEPTVGRDEDGFYLKSSQFGRSDAAEVHKLAAELVLLVNGVARVLAPSYRQIELAGQYVNDEGQHSVIIEPASIEVRSHVSSPTLVVDGHQPPPSPPPLGPRYTGLAANDSNIAEALEILASGLDAVHLYKVYEIIEDDVGGARTIRQRGWASRKAISRFGAATNHPEVSGKLARHARQRGDAPRNPMDLSEARRFLLDLTRKWMDYRAS